jgi:hypothetical protein
MKELEYIMVFRKVCLKTICLLLAAVTGGLTHAYTQININTTNASPCNGKAVITVTTTATGFDFEYALDGGAYQNSGTFENLTPNFYLASVRDKNTQSTFTKQFTIQALPDPNVGTETPTAPDVSVAAGGVTYCNNASASAIIFTSNICYASFNWTSNANVGFGTLGSGKILPFTATNLTNSPVSATVTGKAIANNKTSPPKAFTVTVNPVPAVNPVANATFCNGANANGINFTSNINGATIMWTSCPDVGFGTSGNGNIPGFKATNITNAPVVAAVNVSATINGCIGPPTIFTVTVNPTPVVNSAANATYCNTAAASAINFNSTVAGSTFDWTSSANVGFGTSGNGSIAAFTATNNTNAKVNAALNVKATANGCMGPVTSYSITVNPTPTVNAIANASYCNNAAGNIINFGSNVANATFDWVGTADIGFGVAGSGTNIGAFKAKNTTDAPITTTITVTPSAGACTGPVKTFTVVVNPTPKVNAVGNGVYVDNAAGAAINFAAHVAAATFDWTSTADVGFGIKGNGNIAAFAAKNATLAPIIATVSVTATANSCVGPATTFTITVNPKVAANANIWYVAKTGNDATGVGSVLNPWQTIQFANDNASVQNGDTIKVAAGSYIEDVNITKSLAFCGPNYQTSPVTANRSEEAVISAPPTANPVIFEAHVPSTNIAILGFQLINGSPLTAGNYQTDIANPQSITILFEKNAVMHGNDLFAGTLTRWNNITIKDNYFTNINFAPLSSAIQLNGGDVVTITDNKIETTNFAGVLLDHVASAIVQRNIITSVPGEAGIQLAGAMGNTTVSENDIQNANTNHQVDGGGIRIYGSAFTGVLNVRNNFVTNSFNGFAVKTGEVITNPNIHVNNNSFTNLSAGSFAIYHGGNNPGGSGTNTSASSAQLDAECNWYGSLDASIVAATVHGPVDIMPWLVNGTDNEPASPGFQPVPGSCTGNATCTPPTFVNNGLIILDATCANNDGNINIIPTSGTPPFVYSINGGTTYVAGPDAGYGFQNLSSGTYQLRLKDAKGCESEIIERQVKLSCNCRPPAFVNNGLIILDATCANNDGNVNIIPTSGTAPFMYSINGGVTYVPGPNAGYGFQGLAAGTYKLRLKDATGCESAIIERVVKLLCTDACTPPTFLNNGLIVLDASCSKSDGSISIIPISGTPPFMYSIDGGTTYVAGPNAGYGFQNLAAGTYRLRLKDVRGCGSAVVERTVRNYYNCPGATTSLSPGGLWDGELTNKDVISAYPNPNTGEFKLLLQNFDAPKAEVTIYDAKGILTEKRSLNLVKGIVADFNLKGKAAGLYYIKVTTKNVTKTLKVIIR